MKGPHLTEPEWSVNLRWQLHALSDWLFERRQRPVWRLSFVVDRVALAIYLAWRKEVPCHKATEALAALFGLAGAWLLAAGGGHAQWGWLAFLASNICWLAFARGQRHWWLLVQQVGFTGSSLWGIWAWVGGGRV